MTTSSIERPAKLTSKSGAPAAAAGMTSESSSSSTAKPYAELVFISPDLAQQWLDTMAPNRHLKRRLVERIKADLTGGTFKVNGQTVKRSRTGETLDGQNRLTAGVETGIGFWSFVVYNLEPDVMDTVDTGQNRTLADVFQIRGEQSTYTLAGASRLIYGYEQGMLNAGGIPAVSHSQVESIPDQHEFLRSAVAEVKKTPSVQPASVIAAVYCLAHERDAATADAWLAAVQYGEHLTRNNAAWLLRERMRDQRGGARGQLRGSHIMALAIKSVNAFRAGQELRQLAWRTEGKTPEAFPKLFDPATPAAVAPPAKDAATAAVASA